MTCSTPKPVLCLAGLAALLVLSAKADAQFLSPASGTEQTADHLIASPDSWVPYKAELSEVSGYLQSALNSRVGIFPSGYTSGSRISSDAGAALDQGGSGPAIPLDKVEVSWLNPFRMPLPAADTGGAGSSSTSSPERTSNPQTCLLDHQQLPTVESITWLLAKNQVLPGTPPSARLFRPPRSAA